MTLGDRIQKLRKTKGWSQEQFAELLGVSRQAVSKWETDQASPEIENI
ncbi:MAG: helix-turn-helix domain-containing protein, partial [Clostridia bacterium]|nr:helix-turn-helix domain-containing protein [Clostridia bacterium]